MIGEISCANLFIVATIMEIDFDPRKDSINRTKHGLSLEFAGELWWDEALSWIDGRYHYDELRMIALVPERDQLYHVAFVDHGHSYRIISLRHANNSETRFYLESRLY